MVAVSTYIQRNYSLQTDIAIYIPMILSYSWLDLLYLLLSAYWIRMIKVKMKSYIVKISL